MLLIPIIFEENKSGLQSFNCYVTENEGKLVLIDGGIAHPSFEAYARELLKQHHLQLQDIDEIYLTHHHEDHVGLVRTILREKDVPVYIHREAKPRLQFDGDFLQMRIAFFERFYRKMGCVHDAQHRLKTLQRTYQNRHQLKIEADYHIISDRDQLGRFEIIDLPGHSTDSIGFFDRQRAAIYAGDTLLKHTSTNAIIDPLVTGQYTHANGQQRHSLQKMLHLPIETVYAGHQPIIHDVQETINKKLLKLEQKATKLKALLTQPMTASEVAKLFYGPLYTTQFSLVLSEIAGQLHTLQRRGEIQLTEHNDVYYFENVT